MNLKSCESVKESMTIKECEEMNRTNILNPNYEYYLENLKDGYSVIRARSKTVFEKDAVICCKRTEICQEMLSSLCR